MSDRDTPHAQPACNGLCDLADGDCRENVDDCPIRPDLPRRDRPPGEVPWPDEEAIVEPLTTEEERELRAMPRSSPGYMRPTEARIWATLDDARAEIARLTEELACAKSWTQVIDGVPHDSGALAGWMARAETAENVKADLDTEIGLLTVALERAEARLESSEALRADAYRAMDAAQARCTRLEAVVEAALKWKKADRDYDVGRATGMVYLEAKHYLFAALDALEVGRES